MHKRTLILIKATIKFLPAVIHFMEAPLGCLFLHLCKNKITGTINNIFTYEITMICAVLLIISIVYLIFSLIEATLSAKKIKQKYDRNKSFYKLILDEQDLARILDNDNYYNEDKQYLKSYVKTYVGLWIIVVVILSIFLKYVGTFIK